MKDFDFYFPTRIFFGKDCLKRFSQDLSALGKKAFFIYGKSHLKKSGLYAFILEALKKKNIEWVEFGGIKPNPPLSQVIEGIRLAREFNPDFIVAVGGGSVIDAAKAISCGYFYGEKIWDFFERKGAPERALPIITIPTISGSGSEANEVTVITHDEKKIKLSLRASCLFPKVSYLDPTLTFTVPPNYTAYGVMDILSHLFEFFHFRLYYEENLCEDLLVTLMKRLIKEGKKAYLEPENYSARAQVMWISTLALSPWVRAGVGAYRFFLHSLEHPLSGTFDFPHGLGLTILMRAYLKRFGHHAVVRRFYYKVFDLEEGKDLAKRGLKAFEDILNYFNLPKSLKECGLKKEDLPQLIKKACEILFIWKAEREFNKEIVQEIYEIAYEG
ncbi:MAG: iron-containing alcohol dehydrogenase [Caldimicrobium sp.]